MGEPSDNGAIEKKAKEFFDIFAKCLSPDFEEKYINQMWENTEGLEELEITIFAIRLLALHVFESQNS